ncbi:Calcium/calmodulin-dependent protein kinase kinase 1 [Smittium culicis]|uniref:Calcium/calmodulin-dependent protein kinase kinase 1 n=1 Tax=Smittium culicis TaxID=133412 RepID=A0A1R1XDW6_9FUNG|nr:Calcium/calmodulin-dependent protein kinase kinase 1 [Smittium culicis]
MLLLKEEKERNNSAEKISFKPAMPIQISEIVKMQKKNELDTQFYLIRHELAIHKKLKHTNVVQLHEVIDDPDNDSIHMVFDYCKNGPLFDLSANEKITPLPEKKSRYFFNQAMLGLEFLHRNGIAHRDIKPSNMLITEDNILKISDFGASRIIHKEVVVNESQGTPAFMSPELYSSQPEKADEFAADIWALGVSLYSMIFGTIPFQGESIYEISESVRNHKPNFPKNISPSLVDLINKMLEKDPAKRATFEDIRVLQPSILYQY